MRLTFAAVVGRINLDVTFRQRSLVETEATSMFAEPGLERIRELASYPRPFGARPRREGLGGTLLAFRMRPWRKALSESENSAETWL